MTTHIFDHTQFQNCQVPFNLHEFIPACKKSVHSVHPFVHSSDTVNFRVQRLDWPHPFLTMPNQTIFDQILIFVNLYQHVKNEAVSSISSGEKVDLKILQSDWLRAFWPISQK